MVEEDNKPEIWARSSTEVLERTGLTEASSKVCRYHEILFVIFELHFQLLKSPKRRARGIYLQSSLFYPKGDRPEIISRLSEPNAFFIRLVCSVGVIYLFIVARKEEPKAPSPDIATLISKAFDARATLRGLSLIL